MLLYPYSYINDFSLISVFRFGSCLAHLAWETVNSSFGQNGIQNILGLIELLKSLPPTSVLNETAFNQMKLIKTDRRHRLSAQHLNDIMLVKIESSSIQDFDPTPSINKWMVRLKVLNLMIEINLDLFELLTHCNLQFKCKNILVETLKKMWVFFYPAEMYEF